MAPEMTKTIKLHFPIEYQGSSLTQITVRRPKGRDLRYLPSDNDSSIEKMFPFVAILAGIDESVIDELDASDVTQLTQTVMSFLQPPGKTKRAGS